MERILKTVREIIRTNLPTSIAGKTIQAWYHGDREIIANNKLPAIAFDSEDRKTEFVTFHGYQYEWNFSILCYCQLDYSDDATEFLHRLAHIVSHILQEHTKIWVFEPCFFDGQNFISPAHLFNYESELSSQLTDVESEWQARWNVTHKAQGTEPIPSFPVLNDAEKYAAAYYRYYTEESGSTSSVFTYSKHGNYFTATPYNVIQTYENMKINPVRFLSFVKVDNISYGVSPKINNQYLRVAQIDVSAKEIDPIHIFGPNNVSV